MSDEEVFLTALTIVAAAVVAGGLIASTSRSRGRKLRVLEQALQNSSLTPQTQERLVAELTKPGPLGRLLAGGRLLLVLGWVGIFIGISILSSGGHDAEDVGIPFALMSFGILTIPFALRELDSRRQAASRRS